MGHTATPAVAQSGVALSAEEEPSCPLPIP